MSLARRRNYSRTQSASRRPGYFTDTFCEGSRFFQPHNGARVDAMREHIKRLGLAPEMEAVLLVVSHGGCRSPWIPPPASRWRT